MLTRFGSSQLLASSTFLALAGLVMVYSASAPRAELLTDSSAFYLTRQLGGLLIGVIGAYVLFRIPLEWVGKLSFPLWVVSCLLIAATLTPLGLTENGATRWLAIGPWSLQPLELAKLAVVLALARWLSENQNRMSDVRVSLAVPVLIALVPTGLLLLQPDFGGALLIVLFTGAIVFAAGARLDHLGAAALVTLPALFIAATARGYRLSRLEAFWNPWDDPFGQGYQLIQSLLAFAAGGLTGSGLGAGEQKLGFLPEAHTDFILSVVGEEVGLIGVLGILFCLLFLGLSSLSIASKARNTHAMLIATGCGVLIWLQGILNAGVSVGLIPTTGATLPLFSYGRSSLIVSLAAIGLMLNVARPSRAGRAGWRT